MYTEKRFSEIFPVKIIFLWGGGGKTSNIWIYQNSYFEVFFFIYNVPRSPKELLKKFTKRKRKKKKKKYKKKKKKKKKYKKMTFWFKNRESYMSGHFILSWILIAICFTVFFLVTVRLIVEFNTLILNVLNSDYFILLTFNETP